MQNMNNNINSVCYNCPRLCKCDRINTFGFCKLDNKIRINKIMLHKWEEPCICYNNGSGAIFFSGCNLKCVFCQNYEISNESNGKVYTEIELASLFKQLEEEGACNINLVTPTPYATQILNALKIYKPKIPVVYNTSGYENIEVLKQLNGYVDIYLTDLKYYDENISFEYSKAKDYFEKTSVAILEMLKQQEKLVFENGHLLKGVIIRHLILPNNTSDSIEIAKWLKDKVKPEDAIISLMSQYTPCYKAKEIEKLNRTLTPLEYKRVVNFYKNNTSFENVYIQDLTSANKNYIPDFNKK